MMTLPFEDFLYKWSPAVSLLDQHPRHGPQRIIPITVLYPVENEILFDKLDKLHDGTP